MTPEDNTSDVEGAVRDAEYAFVVIRNKDGRFAIANVSNQDTERQPSLEDIYISLVSLQKDIERQNLTMSIIAAMTQAMNSQNSSGLVVPEKRFVKRK